MIKEQALLFFPHSPDDDLDDLWEQRLFEQKQFFLTRPPIRKVWEARLKRLSQQFDAYLVLTEQKENPAMKAVEIKDSMSFPDDFIESFNAFHVLRNQHKSAVLQAHSMNALTHSVQRWLSTESEYAAHWSHPSCEQDEIEVIRSKEPDPMELLNNLKRTEKALNTSSLNALKENYNNLSESVKKEVKRLTLLAKE